jgi:flagellar hook assembly protein FlgD
VTYQEPDAGVAGGDVQGKFALARNVPNPFGSETAIRFSVPAPGRRVTLRIFDVRGREVATLLEEEEVAGSRTVRWNGTNQRAAVAPAGIYFASLTDGRHTVSRKIVLAR